MPHPARKANDVCSPELVDAVAGGVALIATASLLYRLPSVYASPSRRVSGFLEDHLKSLWRGEQTVTDRVVERATRQSSRLPKSSSKFPRHPEIDKRTKSQLDLDEIRLYGTAGLLPEDYQKGWLRKRERRGRDVEKGGKV
jgi:hypothetical protein